jgi:para-nitrobenzyl esterase
VYEFDWPSAVPGLGACHALEIGFVFDTINSPDWAMLTGGAAPQRLADDLHQAWVRFVTTGDPGWRPWDAAHPVMIFGPANSHEVNGPHDTELTSWRKEWFKPRPSQPSSAH